ncbi:hypothetical protein [Cesiribacter andamanensis]|uniref:YrdC-like domain-containing protein n=1 Tax=Cesiribacter andamanensis AMV16 TaxID=1279009 RepID=M7N367_9BACT|nr:hypothetical protein [Cesiribacter andamanensis]EMR01666.1 hypothetical protein ADICEAN_03213 [Cesiribacter andamanensis AMV16]
MMSNPDTLARHLRNGGFLVLADKSGAWLLANPRNPQALETAAAGAVLPLTKGFVLIGAMDRLYEYVQRFPDLAWDIAEGSEKALLIWYEGGKGVPAAMLDDKGWVGVMLNRCKPLQALLEKLGHGLLCLPLAGAGEGWQALPDVLPLPSDPGLRLAPERIMRLGIGGDVKFLKY